jgi:TonB family protein
MKQAITILIFGLGILAGCSSPGVIVQDHTNGGAKGPDGTMIRRQLFTVAPEYPAELRKQRVTGVVVVRMWVGADGTVAKAAAQPMFCDPRLGRLAEAAVLKWRYEALKVTTSKFMVMEVPITFDLQKPAVAK